MHNTPTTLSVYPQNLQMLISAAKYTGGSVMKWIDQVGYACASNWCGSYAVTVYVGEYAFWNL